MQINLTRKFDVRAQELRQCTQIFVSGFFLDVDRALIIIYLLLLAFHEGNLQILALALCEISTSRQNHCPTHHCYVTSGSNNMMPRVPVFMWNFYSTSLVIDGAYSTGVLVSIITLLSLPIFQPIASSLCYSILLRTQLSHNIKTYVPNKRNQSTVNGFK